MAERKPFLLRIDPTVLDALQRWANDDLRSLNAQIEFVLRRGETGGYAIVETDDLGKVEQATRVFAGFNFHIDPVEDADVARPARSFAIEGRDAAV